MEKVKVTMYLPADTAKKFKMFCAETERSYGDWVEEWLEAKIALNVELGRIYRILAREHLKWTLVEKHPTPQEKATGDDKKAIVVLNELYDLSSDIVGHNTNPFKALEHLEDASIDPLDVYEPPAHSLAARRISEEEYVKIFKDSP